MLLFPKQSVTFRKKIINKTHKEGATFYIKKVLLFDKNVLLCIIIFFESNTFLLKRKTFLPKKNTFSIKKNNTFLSGRLVLTVLI